MKLRNTAIAAALSLMPIGQPLLIGTGAVLTSSAVMLSVPEKAQAESAVFYYNRGIDKSNDGDYSGAISDYTKAIEINPKHIGAHEYLGELYLMMNNKETAECTFNNPLVLMCNEDIRHAQDIIPVMEIALSNKQPPI